MAKIEYRKGRSFKMNKIDVYDLMMFNTPIGEFKVENTDRGRRFKITLKQEFIGDFRLRTLTPLQENGVVDDEGVRTYIKGRVVPRNRTSIDRILKDMGLSEYDPYLIFRHNRGSKDTDDTWVRFNEDERFEDFHPRRRYYTADKDPVKPMIFN